MGGFRMVMFLFDSGIFSKTNGALIFGHGLTELGALGEVHQYYEVVPVVTNDPEAPMGSNFSLANRGLPFVIVNK